MREIPTTVLMETQLARITRDHSNAFVNLDSAEMDRTAQVKKIYILQTIMHSYNSSHSIHGPVVERAISTNPGLNFNPRFLNSLFKIFLGKSSLFFSEHPITRLQTKIIILNSLLKLADLKSNFTLALDYPNPPLNNPTQIHKICFRELQRIFWTERHKNLFYLDVSLRIALKDQIQHLLLP